MSTVGIVGLGLIGGSLARDLAAAGWTVQGTDRDPETEARARDAGVVAGPIRPQELDILVLAVPVSGVSEQLRRLARDFGPGWAGRAVTITDTGSTKRSVTAAAEALGLAPRFVGSHPIAGDHRSGWDAARAGLFDDAPVWICPAPGATPESVERVESLWRAVRARPLRTDPATHDRLLARTSHLPQVAASAVGLVLAEAGIAPDALGPGGRDVTRLAGSEPAMWAEILVDNADEMGAVLASLVEGLERIRDAVDAGDRDALRSLLAAASAWSYGADRGRSTPRMRGEVGGKNASSR